MTRQAVIDAFMDLDALATLRRLYPEATAATGPDWQLWLRENGWTKVPGPIRGAFWTDLDDCGFVAKRILGGEEFVGHDGRRYPAEMRNYSLIVDGG